MPVTPTLDSLLSTIAALQRQVSELTRAVSRPSDQVRDANDNVVHMVPGAANPILGARNQDVSLSMANGTIAITDGQGRDPRPLAASNFIGPVTGDVTGNTSGFHYGPVGDGTTQNQVNATNVYAASLHGDSYGTHHGEVGTPTEPHTTYGDSYGTLHGEHGVPGQAWHSYITCHGNVGVPGDNWTHYGTVVAPSERRLKENIMDFSAGELVDAVPSYRWRWRRRLKDDAHEHAGPMIDDIAEHAPWLVRGEDVRGYGLSDLVGILWAALREGRSRAADLECRISKLEHQ